MRHLTILSVFALAGTASAGLVDAQADSMPGSSSFVDDGVVSMGEYSASWSNGAGTGFGGTLGNSTLSMDTDGTNLYIAWEAAGGVNDNAALWLSTNPANGVTNGEMNDTADGGRNAVSNFVGGPFGVDMPSRAEYGIVFGNFGNVTFITNAGDTPGHLTFDVFQGDQTGGTYEIAIPLSSLGAGATYVNWWMGYTSDSTFASNETIPAQGDYNTGDNPGFNEDPGDGQLVWENFNQFQLPTPGAVSLFGLAGLAAARRRR
ncbi:MAG: hypothetical protein Tsb0013_05980 [Phycisphaerales bacterium]